MEHIKFINALQAKVVHLYKNTKEKLLKTNRSVWINKMCIRAFIGLTVLNYPSNARIRNVLIPYTNV